MISHIHKRTLIVPALLLALTSCTGTSCASSQPKPSPQVQVIQAADDVVSVLRTLSHAVETAADQKLITIDQARQILLIIRATTVSLRETPEGGFPVAIAAVEQIEATVPPEVRVKIQPYLVTARAALEVFRGR